MGHIWLNKEFHIVNIFNTKKATYSKKRLYIINNPLFTKKTLLWIVRRGAYSKQSIIYKKTSVVAHLILNQPQEIIMLKMWVPISVMRRTFGWGVTYTCNNWKNHIMISFVSPSLIAKVIPNYFCYKYTCLDYSHHNFTTTNLFWPQTLTFTICTPFLLSISVFFVYIGMFTISSVFLLYDVYFVLKMFTIWNPLFNYIPLPPFRTFKE